MLREAEECIASLGALSYERVYTLNQHARSRLLAQLCADPIRRMADTETWEEQMRPWAQYLRQVARERGRNRIHLADAWCGMCGVRPQGRAPLCDPSAGNIPQDLAAIGEREGLWVALAVGAGETDRCVPTGMWSRWIQTFLSQRDDGHVVLIGSGQERKPDRRCLKGCRRSFRDMFGTAPTDHSHPADGGVAPMHWIVGADTGPLHVGTLVGVRALGFYFSRARVHETGPYGTGHWVYQSATTQQPNSWPVAESIALICDDRQSRSDDWTLWRSHMDEWGVWFDDGSASQASEATRAAMWQSLSPELCRSTAA
jgi:ADP-heptose:LPS heptosyltransferase